MAALPANARVLYRICTRKSSIDFGKYAGLRVGDIINLDPTYIPFLYYNASMISFSKDILDEFQITEIPKPGTSEEGWKAYKRKIWKDKYDDLDEDEFMKKRHIEKSRIRRETRAAAIRSEIYHKETKGRMMARNHGHIK